MDGRQILDEALIACEAIHWIRKNKKVGVIVKLDFQKAYDLIRWCFVDYTMENMDFGLK